jgi:hypothetical protein
MAEIRPYSQKPLQVYQEEQSAKPRSGFYQNPVANVISDNVYDNVSATENIGNVESLANKYYPESSEVTPLFRLQNNVPSVYVNSSRDFQLLCRLYDMAFNGVMFDTDTISDITNTDRCSARLLPLLQTKIGFFTDIEITDEDLRYVLKAFPYLVRNKGSKQAIRQALYMYMRMNHIETEIMVQVLNKHPIMPYTILVGIETGFRDVAILDEVFKYILPTGYTVQYVYYQRVNGKLEFVNSDYGSILLTPDIVNSQVRGNSPTFPDGTPDNLIGAVDTVEVIGNDEYPTTYGYYYNGEFYTGESGTGEVIHPHWRAYYVDIPTDETYKYDRDNEEYVLAYGVVEQP